MIYPSDETIGYKEEILNGMQMAQFAVRERSYSSVKAFRLDREYITRHLEKAIDTLWADPNILKVILFGSFPEGGTIPGSDIDILIILKNDSRRFIGRIQEYLDSFTHIWIAVDVFLYIPDGRGNPLVCNELFLRKKKLFERYAEASRTRADHFPPSEDPKKNPFF